MSYIPHHTYCPRLIKPSNITKSPAHKRNKRKISRASRKANIIK